MNHNIKTVIAIICVALIIIGIDMWIIYAIFTYVKSIIVQIALTLITLALSGFFLLFLEDEF